MSHALVVMSGGQDSTTCAFWALQNFQKVSAITFDYGQRHDAEIVSAGIVCKELGIDQEIVEVPNVLVGTSPLVSSNELEEYEDAGSMPGGLEKTFVPCRNQFFLTLAANRAFNIGALNLVTGVSAEDYGGYPDCRPQFLRAIEDALNLGTFTGEEGTIGPLKIHAPLMKLTKAQTVDLAWRLPGCYEALAYTHTAYSGEFPPRTNDHATLLRAKGFMEAGLPDPLILRAAFLDKDFALPVTPNYDGVRNVAKSLQQETFAGFLEAVIDHYADKRDEKHAG